MPLYVPTPLESGRRFWTLTSTRPITNQGTSVSSTTTASTYGSYTEIVSDTDVTEDVCGIQIDIGGGVVASTSLQGTVTIGIDNAGGTSYADAINDLIAGSPNSGANSAPRTYYFPLYIKAGSSIAAKYATTGTTARSCRVSAKLFFMPKHPGDMRVGHKVETIGGGAATGTAVTAGNAAYGSWTQIGSNPTLNHWWWQVGLCENNDASLSALQYGLDVAKGDGSNKHIMFEQLQFTEGAAETWAHSSTPFMAHAPIGLNDLLYIRAAAQSAPTNLLCALYGCA